MNARTPPTREGKRWTTDEEAPSSTDATPSVWSDSAQRLVVLGYITAVALPVIGLILGIVVAARPTKSASKHGAWIIVIAIIASVVWTLIIASGFLTLTTNDINS